MKNRVRSHLLLFLELVIVGVAIVWFFPSNILAGVGSPNATVITSMSIANTAPDVTNVSLDDPITLVPNSTILVTCMAVVEDFDSDTDIVAVNATLYDPLSSFALDTDDNNHHYTNSSCTFETSYGTFNGYDDDSYRALANCSFELWYYANAGSWVCNVSAFDTSSSLGINTDTGTVSQLLALGLPDTLDYGLVNATDISVENMTNITNYGNVAVNLSLEGYGVTVGDGLAMNCTLGSIGTISIEHEKYNLTASNTSVLTLGQADSIYTNLTTNPTIRFFNLTWRSNDSVNDVWKPAYWRMYVPLGVAGNCTGNIIFGATTAAGT